MRAQAAEVLREMSTELVKIGENAAGIEARKTFVDACKPVTDSAEVSLQHANDPISAANTMSILD